MSIVKVVNLLGVIMEVLDLSKLLELVDDCGLLGLGLIDQAVASAVPGYR